MLVQSVDPSFHPSSPELLGQSALYQRLDQNPDRVEHGSGADHDQPDREDLVGAGDVLGRTDLAVADGRDGYDGLVDRVEQVEPQAQVPDGSHEEDPDQNARSEAKSPPQLRDLVTRRLAYGAELHAYRVPVEKTCSSDPLVVGGCRQSASAKRRPARGRDRSCLHDPELAFPV